MSGNVILLVDDHADSRAAIAALLRNEGMTVFEAQDGAEAVRTFVNQNGNIDLLISDMKMPGMDGLELMDKLGEMRERMGRPPRMKSIALTGYPKEFTETDTAIYSFDEYIEKTGDFEDLLRAIRGLLET